MQEIWKPVKDYEGSYEVSNYGRVRSIDRYVFDKGKPSFRKGVDISICKMPQGYEFVTLYQENKQKHKLVHRLVAEAFIENPYNYNEINHIDCNKTNNIVSNLEWCSRKHNVEHAKRNGLLKNEQFYVPVAQINKDGVVINKYGSLIEAANKVDGIPQNIGHCCKHETMSMYGYYWEYDTGDYSIGQKVDVKNRAIIKSQGKTLKPVAQVDIKTNRIIKLYPSMKSAGEDNNCHPNFIGKCCNGRLREYRGYKWCHATPEMKIGDMVNE